MVALLNCFEEFSYDVTKCFKFYILYNHWAL